MQTVLASSSAGFCRRRVSKKSNATSFHRTNLNSAGADSPLHPASCFELRISSLAPSPLSHLREGISEFSVIREALDALLEQAPAGFTVPGLAKGP